MMGKADGNYTAVKLDNKADNKSINLSPTAAGKQDGKDNNVEEDD